MRIQCPDQCGVETISVIQARRSSKPIQITPVWDQCRSQDILQVNEICLGTSTETGNTSGILLRRRLPVSQDEGGDGNKCQDSHITSSALGFHHQLQEEQTPTGTLSRVSRFLIQYKDDEDRCIEEETGGHIFTYQASVEDNQDLPMDSCLIGQDDSTAASSRRSADSHAVYLVIFGKELDGKTSSMGATMSSIQSCSRRTSLMANTESAFKDGLPIMARLPVPPAVTIHVDASDSGWGITSDIIKRYGFWNKNEKQLSINVRELMTIRFALQAHAQRF
ncbi:hypothetical protein RMATCC62417_00804 [Rhizopus microsporus]|nr:hypothetical protein RMATCC62417_00804 [Rhizopus microsporus]